MQEEPVPILGFRRNALIQRTGRGGHVTYWRYLLSDDKYMYVMQVQVGKAPKNSLPYERWELRKHLGLFGTVIQEIEEIVCPKWMLNAEPDSEASNDIASKWNKIAWAIDEAGDLLITDERVRAHYIKEAAKLAEVKEPRIRSLLTRYFYYGQHKYALMSLDPFKGAGGVKRFNITKVKMGRPNDNVVLDSGTKFTGRNMTPYYYRRWKEVLWEEYVGGNKSVSEAYEVLLLRLRAFNRGADGQIVSYPIAPEKLPERALFLRYGAKVVKEFDMKRAKLGELEWGNKHAALKGHSEDLTHRVIDIYDFDGMEFNIEVLYGEIPAGKPNVLLAVDRRSRAVVGWYIWIGKENGFAYKHCLFSAFTSKESRLLRYNVSHLTGFVYGVCEQAMFDRGPGISLEVTKSVTERIRVDGLMTRPRDAKGKAVVENVNGILQKKLADLPGAYKRTDSIRDQDKQRDAAACAKIEYEKFVQLLLCAVSDYNLYTVVSDLLTADMIKAKVKPNPKAVFLWNRNQRRGDAAYDWPPAAIYKNLLERREVVATNGVVTVSKATYRSDALALYYEQWNSGPGKKRQGPLITVYIFAETDKILVWEKSDGSLVVLEMMDRYKKQYEDSPGWLHNFINQLKNGRERIQRLDQAKKATLSIAKEKAIREADGLPKNRVVKGEKSANRAKGNSRIVGEDLSENLRLLGHGAKEPTKGDSINAEVGLVGYRKPNRNDISEDPDW